METNSDSSDLNMPWAAYNEYFIFDGEKDEKNFWAKCKRLQVKALMCLQEQFEPEKAFEGTSFFHSYFDECVVLIKIHVAGKVIRFKAGAGWLWLGPEAGSSRTFCIFASCRRVWTRTRCDKSHIYSLESVSLMIRCR